jgi:hypothetical protein
MSNPAHKTALYEAEYKVWIEYCVICGAEENELDMPCSGEKEQKKVDTDKERS